MNTKSSSGMEVLTFFVFLDGSLLASSSSRMAVSSILFIFSSFIETLEANVDIFSFIIFFTQLKMKPFLLNFLDEATPVLHPLLFPSKLHR